MPTFCCTSIACPPCTYRLVCAPAAFSNEVPRTGKLTSASHPCRTMIDAQLPDATCKAQAGRRSALWERCIDHQCRACERSGFGLGEQQHSGARPLLPSAGTQTQRRRRPQTRRTQARADRLGDSRRGAVQYDSAKRPAVHDLLLYRPLPILRDGTQPLYRSLRRRRSSGLRNFGAFHESQRRTVIWSG